MRSITCVVCLTVLVILAGCSGPAPQTSAPVEPQASASVAVDPDVAEENQAAAEDGQPAKAPVPSNARRVRARSAVRQRHQHGQPQASGLSVAQCRGRFADFIVLKTTIPANYAGPWFTTSSDRDRAHGHPCRSTTVVERRPTQCQRSPGVCAVATELCLRKPCRTEPHAHAHERQRLHGSRWGVRSRHSPVAEVVPGSSHNLREPQPAGHSRGRPGHDAGKNGRQRRAGRQHRTLSQLRRRLLRRARRAHVCACVVHIEPRR